MTTEKQWEEAMDALFEYRDEIDTHNSNILLQVNAKASDFEKLVEDVKISGKMEIVNEPQGYNQDETYESFQQVYVDQWSVGMSGDTFEGTIYAQLEENKWLSIPFSIY